MKLICIHVGFRDNSSFRLNTLGLLCLWQCFLVRFPSPIFFLSFSQGLLNPIFILSLFSQGFSHPIFQKWPLPSRQAGWPSGWSGWGGRRGGTQSWRRSSRSFFCFGQFSSRSIFVLSNFLPGQFLVCPIFFQVNFCFVQFSSRSTFALPRFFSR